jgi:hypothetical protein
MDESNYAIKSLSLVKSSLNVIGTAPIVARWTAGNTVINVDEDSNLGTSDDFLDMRGITLNFESGAKADLGAWEFKTPCPSVGNLKTYAIASPAMRPVVQAAWKLKPPVIRANN